MRTANVYIILHKNNFNFIFADPWGYSGCGAVGSAPGLGPGGPVFESRYPDLQNRTLAREQVSVLFFILSKNEYIASGPLTSPTHESQIHLFAVCGADDSRERHGSGAKHIYEQVKIVQKQRLQSHAGQESGS